MSENSDIYELKTALLDNRKLEEFLLLVRNFKTTLKATGILDADAKIKYLCTLVLLSVEVVSTPSEHLKLTILGLGTYLYLLLVCQNKIARYAAKRGSHAV